ncbi:unnamed protein product [Prorocentrum cordatum]|uniref:Protein-tyrosine-phosphatase n=1 Tax=Prorocentrum cordatum TaxID=2364126 RepID=A0ABN9VLQ5_9DINO|nr:unnamed protein product [Polarella glacialis]
MAYVKVDGRWAARASSLPGIAGRMSERRPLASKGSRPLSAAAPLLGDMGPRSPVGAPASPRRCGAGRVGGCRSASPGAGCAGRAGCSATPSPPKVAPTGDHAAAPASQAELAGPPAPRARPPGGRAEDAGETGFHWILDDFLAVGSSASAGCSGPKRTERCAFLTEIGITHIVNCSQEFPCPFQDAFEYLQLPARDEPSQDLIAFWPAACAFVEEANAYDRKWPCDWCTVSWEIDGQL